MIDIKKIFDNVLFAYMDKKYNFINNEKSKESFKPEFLRYFNNIPKDSFEKIPISSDWKDFQLDLNDKEKLIHIFFWNLVNKIEILGNKIIPSGKEGFGNKEGLESVKDGVNKKEIEKRLEVLSLEEDYTYSSSFSFIKFFYHFALVIIFLVFLIYRQFKNLKILFFILLLVLIPYAVNPIYEFIKEKTYDFNRFVQLSISYIFLLVIFGLFISFKSFVFDEEGAEEGKRDLYILLGIMGVGFFILFFNWIYYGNFGSKKD